MKTVTQRKADWKLFPLGEIVQPIRPRVKPSDKPDLQFIGMDSIESQSMKLLRTVPAGTMKSSAVHFQPGDVLYGRLRPYLNKVYRPNFEGLCSAEFIVLPENDQVDGKYLQYFLNSAQFVSYASHLNEGDRPRVNFKQLSDYLVPLPPTLDQQRSVVAEIEKQFSRLDEAVTSLKRAKANLKRYKAAVLKAAVEGKLTAEWRKQHTDVEPATELLKRILIERRCKWEEAELAKMRVNGKEPKDDGWKKKYKEPASPKASKIYSIPEHWVWSNLGQLSWSVKDGPHYSPKYSDEGIPFISGGNVRPEGIDFSSVKYISPKLHAELSVRCKPEKGDLLFTKGGTTGIALINNETREFNVWVHVAVLKLVDSIERIYVQHALNSPFCYSQSQQYTHGVGNQDLGLTRMIWITVPVPPIEEQAEIIKVIEERYSVIVALDKQIREELKQAESLRQSFLDRAFLGTLITSA